MAANQGKKTRRSADPQTEQKMHAEQTPVPTTSVGTVVPMEAMGLSSWEQEEDVLAAAIRSYFLSHTLDPLTGEVHTLH